MILSDKEFQTENGYVQVSDLVQISRPVNTEAHRWYSKVLSLTMCMWSWTKLNGNKVLKPKTCVFLLP